MTNVAAEEKTEMVLVPRHPTKEMLDAAWADAHDEDAEGVWKSMIDAIKPDKNPLGMEVTPEMIEAGEHAIWEGLPCSEVDGGFSAPDFAVKVYQAMLAVMPIFKDVTRKDFKAKPITMALDGWHL